MSLFFVVCIYFSFTRKNINKKILVKYFHFFMIDVAKCYRVSEDTKCYKLRCIGVEVKGPCLQSYPEYNLRQPGPGTAGPRPRGAAAAEGSGDSQETVWPSGPRDPAPSLTSLCNVMLYSYPQHGYLYLMLAATSPVFMTVLCIGDPLGEGESTP